MPSLTTVATLLSHYGYFILFPLAVIEGPVVTLLAGVAISLGYMDWVPASIVIVLGDTVGDVLHYAAGRWGGKRFIERWGKYIGMNERHIEALEKVFYKREGKAFLLGKLAHGFSGALLVAAGMVGMDFTTFLFWNVLGTIPKSLALLLIGYRFAHVVTKVNSVLDVVASVGIIAAVVAVLVWIYIYGRKVYRDR